jgi:hypothetical protein
LITTVRTQTGHIVPAFIDPGGNYRILGRIKTNRPKIEITPFLDYLQTIQNPVFDLTTLPPYDRFQTNIPILDQGQVGSCVAHAHASAMMKSRDLAGSTYTPLSPDSLYAAIDNGVDQGSDPADAITALQKTGICLLSDVPDNFILASAISPVAMQNALRFLIVPEGVYSCASLAEMVTADALGFSTTMTVNVGSNFNPGSNGVVGYTPGFANHCVSGGEAFDLISGVPSYRLRNSWTTDWGINGCGWVQSRHIDLQPGVEMYAIKWVLIDDLDVLNPP